MSFRNRLALFFVLIVIVPMLAVAFLLFRLIAESQTGQKEAGIAQQYRVAQKIFEDYRAEAGAALDEKVSKDKIFTARLVAGDSDGAAARARQLVMSQDLARILIVRPNGDVVGAGSRKAVAPASRPVELESGERLGTLQVAAVDAQALAERIKEVAGLDVVVRNGGKTLATTLPQLGARALPASSDNDTTIALAGQDYRVKSFLDTQAFKGQAIRVYTLGSLASAAADVRSRRIAAGAILLGFFFLAIICAVLVSRSLQQQIANFLAAARRLASGDFSAKVPTTGHDEFAALGEEFNKMSADLESRLEELRLERERAQSSMRRLGEAVGSNLDRDALLALVVRTAVDGVGADAGRAAVRINGGTTMHESHVGNMNGIEAAVQSVENEALSSGTTRETTLGSASAIAHPLRRADGGSVVGVVSVGRSGRPFSPSDRDLLQYLAGQAAQSLVNVERHETAARESVTDDLTGLSNRRAFDDFLTAEIERSRRYGSSVALVLIDLDNFKTINDTYLHQTGDLVLREVAKVLRDSSREIDHPARYGGEELAVILPGTDLEGAFNLAERVRERIAGLRIARLDGRGTINVTASCGVAAVPPTEAEERAIVAAADAALYEAKRSGKNLSVRAR